MTDIFEEVDESLRQDTALKWWNRALPYLIVLGVLVLVGVGGYEFWRMQRAQAVNKQAEVYATGVAALEKKDLPAAKAAFAQLGKEEGGFATLANHMLAQVEKETATDPAAGQAAAQAALTAASDDKNVMADVALLKLAYAKADTATLADIEKLLAPLTVKGGYASALARELIAAKAFAAGDIERARAEYQALSFEIEAPQSMKVRVQQTLLTFPPKPAAAAAPATAPAATPAPASPATPPAPPAQPPAQPGQ